MYFKRIISQLKYINLQIYVLSLHRHKTIHGRLPGHVHLVMHTTQYILMREEKSMCIKGCNVFRLCTKSIFKSFYTQKKELKWENNTKKKRRK